MGRFEAPKTIAGVIGSIGDSQYVLPAIQREFVWREEKICALFDSLMRRYPIGGFLFWKVTNETFFSHTFYGFLSDYDPRGTAKYSPVLTGLPPSDDRYAILDGQQRLPPSTSASAVPTRSSDRAYIGTIRRPSKSAGSISTCGAHRHRRPPDRRMSPATRRSSSSGSRQLRLPKARMQSGIASGLASRTC